MSEQKICGCGGDVIARGMCRRCYNREYMRTRDGGFQNVRRVQPPVDQDAGRGAALGFVYFAFTLFALPVANEPRLWRPMPLIKIGYSRNWLNRRIQLEQGFPLELQFILVARGRPSTERDLHELFSAHRVKWEWFKADPVLTWLHQMRAQKIGGKWSWFKNTVVHDEFSDLPLIGERVRQPRPRG